MAIFQSTTVICDTCDAELDVPTGNAEEARRIADAKGWDCDGSNQADKCPSCKDADDREYSGPDPLDSLRYDKETKT